MSSKSGLMFSIFMALGMSLIMSFVMTALNVGFVADFVLVWLRGFVVAFCAAVPATMLVAPIAHRAAVLVQSGLQLGCSQT